MQRDTNRKFGEIHDTKENLIQSIEHIIDVALVKPDEVEPLKLRFVTPLHIPTDLSADNLDWPAYDQSTDYRLTSTEEHIPSLEYISVSYCWKHTQSPDGIHVPDYRISEGSEWRSIRCPPLVFHRAFQFARRHGCAHVWIDQECIDQNDPADIERHLQIMHRVYRESKWTVAALSWPIRNCDILEQLIKTIWTLDMASVESHEKHNDRNQIILQGLESLCNIIYNEPWFRRTWAFQEKLCAQSLQLLVPLGPKLCIPDVFNPLIIGNDLCLPTTKIGHRLDDLGYGPFGVRLKTNWHAKKGWTRPFSLNMKNLYLWLGWNHDSNMLLNYDKLSEASEWHGYFKVILSTMEECDNLIVADRISILGNITQVENRFLSNRLDSSMYSFSTCVLALILANHLPDAVERAKSMSDPGWNPLCYDLGEVMSGVCDAASYSPNQCSGAIKQRILNVTYNATTSSTVFETSTALYIDGGELLAEVIEAIYREGDFPSSVAPTTSTQLHTPSQTSLPPTSPATTTKAQTEGLSTAAKAGIGVGASLGALLALAALGFVLYRMGKRRAARHEQSRADSWAATGVKAELHAESVEPRELAGTMVQEMDGDTGSRVELQGSTPIKTVEGER
ncbi:hypothetical protein N0V83_006397 [Neocucurbitaria cava]|uniref:Heterokaryon incompatibility domain-containing protein n=1 Tax=Neocucurbitaria cava TaxID=798079 RepID=A0A9W9CL28_9PLEO|nr:hypothetical protein N0V83_006397 [Neocucurbitaria cava]